MLAKQVVATRGVVRPSLAKVPSRMVTVQAKKKAVKAPEPEPEEPQLSSIGLAATVAGLVANPIMLYSEYVLKTTGSGLEPGPAGLYGLAEGISFLVVPGIVGWSLFTKIKTGSGLPVGPYGLTGAVEGVSYLTTLGAIIVFALTFADKGALPGITG